MSYDYHENIKDDCVTAIKEYLGYHDVKGMSKETLKEKFRDAFWVLATLRVPIRSPAMRQSRISRGTGTCLARP